jgi:hypothetical protein
MPLTEDELYDLAWDSDGLQEREALIRAIYDREAQFYTMMAQMLAGAAVAAIAALSGISAVAQARLVSDEVSSGAGWLVLTVIVSCTVAAAVFARRASLHPRRLYQALRIYNGYAELRTRLTANHGAGP